MRVQWMDTDSDEEDVQRDKNGMSLKKTQRLGQYTSIQKLRQQHRSKPRCLEVQNPE